MRPDAGPQAARLPEDHWLLLQKEEEELTIRPVPPWDVPLRTAASDPTPPDRMPLLPCFHKASSQLQY